MWRTLKKYVFLCYRAGDNLVDNYGLEMAGYLTFLTLLALFPYLVLTVSAMGLIGQGEMGSHFIALMMEHLPEDAVRALRPRVEEITSGPPQGILTFSILGAIWTSSSAVEAVRGMLNRAYRVHKPPAYLRRRLTSMVQIILLTALILIIMLVFVFTPIILRTFTHYTDIAIPIELDHLIGTYFKPIGALCLLMMIAAFYYVLPNIKQRWAAVMPGALLVLALWVGGASLIGVYLNDISNVTLVYGSLSGFIATLITFYMLNLIFIYGAEFNHEWMLLHGERIVEKEVPEDVTVH